jgi:ribosomal protein S18 acetylase RimI-like enzyme
MELSNIKFAVKKLSIDEITVFFRLHDDDYYEKLSDRIDIDEYSQKVHEGTVQFTLYDKDVLIGFSPCYFNNIREKIGYISSITIRSGYRNLNLGSEILQRIKKYAVEHDFYAVAVQSHCQNRINGGFYEKNGFKLFHKEKDACIYKYSAKRKALN